MNYATAFARNDASVNTCVVELVFDFNQMCVLYQTKHSECRCNNVVAR